MATEQNDVAAFTMGQAAALIGVTPAFLRSLDESGLIEAGRSSGGHRRYSRHQLDLAARVRQLLDQGFLLAAACRIVTLEDRLAAAHRHIAELGGTPGPGEDARIPTRTRDPGADTGHPAHGADTGIPAQTRRDLGRARHRPAPRTDRSPMTP